MFGIKTRYARLKKQLTKKAIVLMYHSISEPDIDPWEIVVSPANFEQQLQVLKKHFVICPVIELVQGIHKRQLKNNCIAITFDDGYRNNFDTAKPLLEKYQLPATFFITSKDPGDGNIFWWDELANIIMKTSVLPRQLNVKIEDIFFDYAIEEESLLTPAIEHLHREWVAPGNPPTKRSKLYYTLWQRMQPLPDVELNKVLSEIRNWAGRKHITLNEQHIITKEQLQQIASHQLFEIGVHTVNHVALSFHSAQVQESEITQNRQDLETIIQKKVNTMAYPYGEYNDTTLDIVKRVGLQAAFSVEYNPVLASSNPFNLGRFQVKNWNGKQFEEKLVKWLKQ